MGLPEAVTSRKKPCVAFWATVILFVALVVYPLSHGPTRWLVIKAGSPRWLAMTYAAVYTPLYNGLALGPEWLMNAAIKYRSWWSNLGAKRSPVMVP